MVDVLSSIKTASGLDIPKLSADLATAEVAGRKDLATKKQAAADSAISGLASLRATMGKLKGDIAGLLNRTDLGWSATSSLATEIVPSFTAGAAPSALRAEIAVQSMAREQVSVSPARTPAGSAVGTGAITLQFGSRSSGSFVADVDNPGVVVPITTGANSLAGIAAAIRKAEPRLQATVLNTSQGERLSLRGPSGEDFAFALSAVDDSSSGLSSLVSSLVTSQQATDAAITVDGATVRSQTNTFVDVLPGVSLDISKAAVGRIATVETAMTSTQLSDGINAFVEQLNALGKEMATLMARGVDGKPGGPLAGDTAARQLVQTLRGLSSVPLVTPEGESLTLAELGVRTNRDGTLMVDSTILNRVIAANPARVAAVLHTGLGGNHLGITPVRVGATPSGTYTLSDMVPATAGSMTGTANLTNETWPLSITAGSNALRIKVGSVTASSTLALPAGSYAGATELAAALETAANLDPVLRSAKAFVSVSVTSAGALQITSRTLGSGSAVSLVSADAALESLFGLSGAALVSGVNASGKINGAVATSSGAQLRGALGSVTEGLAVAVGAYPQDSTVVVTRGIFDRLTDMLEKGLATGSPLSARDAYWTKQKTDAGTQLSALDEEYKRLDTRYRLSFGQMETMVRDLNSTGDFLSNQMKMWTSNN